uniref:Uncharacterized protein n=1 Tax=Anser brachyrhynchus TaxID=132585 RepID=A0A8B9D0I9_9AVES
MHSLELLGPRILCLSCIFPPFLQAVCTKLPPSKKTFVFTGSFFLSSIPGESIKGVAMNFSAELGSIHTRNGSIMITCDGPYLVSLKAKLSPDLDDNSSLKLMMRKTENKNVEPLWEQTIQGSSSTVDLITMLYLFAQDNITLWTSLNVTVMELSFSLVLLKPVFCLL